MGRFWFATATDESIEQVIDLDSIIAVTPVSSTMYTVVFKNKATMDVPNKHVQSLMAAILDQ